jgi:hypothetical protein
MSGPPGARSNCLHVHWLISAVTPRRAARRGSLSSSHMRSHTVGSWNVISVLKMPMHLDKDIEEEAEMKFNSYIVFVLVRFRNAYS